MSPSEAQWFSEALRRQPAELLSPMLNLGSSTRAYRTEVCPHIDSVLLGPLRDRGVTIRHCDLKSSDGVDIVGDISDTQVRERIRGEGIRSVLCNNLLEHVDDVMAMCRSIAGLCPVEGLLCVSVPNAYPFHPDPIDNGFRPSVDELSAIFGQYGFELVESAAVQFGCYGDSLKSSPRLILRDLYLLLVGAFRRDKWRVLFGNYRYLRRQYAVSCAVFKRRRIVDIG